MNLLIDPIAALLGPWAGGINLYSALLRLLLSLLLSAIIGCERSSKRHSAGLRTFMLVSLSGTAAMLMDLFLSAQFGKLAAIDSSVQLSGGWYLLSASSVIAVGVMCVNSVFFSSRNQIKGLTTSFGLWAILFLGICIGAGFYTLAALIFLVFLCCLAFFPTFEIYLKNRSNHFEIHLELKSSANLQDFTATIRKLGLHIDDIELNPAYAGSGLSVYSISVSIMSEELKKYKTHEDIIEALSSLEYVAHIEEMRS